MAANTEIARLDWIEKSKMDELMNSQTLPKTTSSDNGKVLGVNSGKWAKVTLPDELPAVTADDNGKVLMVVNGEWAVAALPTEPAEEPTT